MIRKFSLVLGLAALVGATPVIAGTVSVAPTHARSYGKTDPLELPTTAVMTINGLTALVDDDTSPIGNEFVWRVIGELPQTQPEGEAYCGSIPLGGQLSDGIQRSEIIEDLVGVVAFDVPSTSKRARGASLEWSGSNLGAYISGVDVSVCVYDGVGEADNFGAEGDCIIDGLNFSGGSFVSIHDVNGRKEAPSVGGFSDLNFGDVFPTRSIALSDAAVDAINAANGGRVSLLVECTNSGAQNGFLGSGSNVLVLHDVGGVGFPGNPGSLTLSINY